jgi:hypothetical protein
VKCVHARVTVAFLFFLFFFPSRNLAKRKQEEVITTMAFRWSQNASTVTITFPVAPSVKKSDVDVTVVNTQLRAGVKGSVPLCEGSLSSPVKGFKWSLKAGIVSIQLEKSMKVKWNDLLVCIHIFLN